MRTYELFSAFITNASDEVDFAAHLHSVSVPFTDIVAFPSLTTESLQPYAAASSLPASMTMSPEPSAYTAVGAEHGKRFLHGSFGEGKDALGASDPVPQTIVL